jgi:hypothetical protein
MVFSPHLDHFFKPRRHQSIAFCNVSLIRNVLCVENVADGKQLFLVDFFRLAPAIPHDPTKGLYITDFLITTES